MELPIIEADGQGAPPPPPRVDSSDDKPPKKVETRPPPYVEPPPPYESKTPAHVYEYDQDKPITHCACDNFCETLKMKLAKRNFILYDWRIGAGVFVLCFAVFMGIVFGKIVKDIEKRGNFEQTLCFSHRMFVSEYRCCEIGGCNCETCNSPYLSCGEDLTRQPYNKTVCCGGYKCCGSCCDRCSRRVCNSDGDCRTEYYDCNCRCCSSTPRKSCAVDCGTCGNYMVIYYTEAVPALNLTYTKSCSLDKFKCMLEFKGRYADGSVWDCWYDTTDPTDVTFDGMPEVDKAAIAFSVIFGLGLVACVAIYILWPLWVFTVVLVDTIFREACY